MEYPVQRYFRDSRFLLYGGGTHEILQANIGRELGLVSARGRKELVGEVGRALLGERPLDA